ncbi:MAG: hypothetical protein GY710_25595 [Desulfobacteraceae bacterium]|nr:hypothetical protein [Desulfobacteraceae bacterium]
MKNKTALLLCFIGYLIVIFLILTEPLQYDPLIACIVAFAFFSILFLFFTSAYSPIVYYLNRLLLEFKNLLPEKLIRYCRMAYNFMDAIFPYLLMLIIGWLSHSIWNNYESNRKFIIWLIYFVFLAVNTILKKNVPKKRI